MKAQKEEEGSGEALQKGLQRNQWTEDVGGGDERTVYWEVGGRDADYGLIYTQLKHILLLPLKTPFAKLSV